MACTYNHIMNFTCDIEKRHPQEPMATTVFQRKLMQVLNGTEINNVRSVRNLFEDRPAVALSNDLSECYQTSKGLLLGWLHISCNSKYTLRNRPSG